MMDGHKCISDYLGSIGKAEVYLREARRGEVRFNDSGSPGEYWEVLMEKEVRVMYEVFKLKLLSRKDRGVRGVIGQYVLDLRGMVECGGGHYTHRHLHLTRDDRPVDPDTLDTAERLLVDEYLRLQMESYLRFYVLVHGVEGAPSSPYHFNVTDTEAAEWLDVIYHSGRWTCDLPGGMKKDFVYFVCRAFNWSVDKDYDTLMSHVGGRPNPTRFLDKLREDYLTYLDKKGGGR